MIATKNYTYWIKEGSVEVQVEYLSAGVDVRITTGLSDGYLVYTYTDRRSLRWREWKLVGGRLSGYNVSQGEIPIEILAYHLLVS